MNNHSNLCNLLNELGAVKTGSFVGKSGEKYSVETDIRNAMKTFSNSLCVAEEIYKEIVSKLGFFSPVIGVPETGSVISFFVNQIYFSKTKTDFSFNMLRAVPKYYQSTTDSVYTVFPLNSAQEYILIEDDVVTGNTLLRFLKEAISNSIRIRAVVVVFGRKSALSVMDYCSQNNIIYCELISVDDIS